MPAGTALLGYGTTQQAYAALAYTLAACGLQVLRYDHSRHIGLSDGDPTQTTPTTLKMISIPY